MKSVLVMFSFLFFSSFAISQNTTEKSDVIKKYSATQVKKESKEKKGNIELAPNSASSSTMVNERTYSRDKYSHQCIHPYVGTETREVVKNKKKK